MVWVASDTMDILILSFFVMDVLILSFFIYKRPLMVGAISSVDYKWYRTILLYNNCVYCTHATSQGSFLSRWRTGSSGLVFYVDSNTTLLGLTCKHSGHACMNKTSKYGIFFFDFFFENDLFPTKSLSFQVECKNQHRRLRWRCRSCDRPIFYRVGFSACLPCQSAIHPVDLCTGLYEKNPPVFHRGLTEAQKNNNTPRLREEGRCTVNGTEQRPRKVGTHFRFLCRRRSISVGVVYWSKLVGIGTCAKESEVSNQINFLSESSQQQHDNAGPATPTALTTICSARRRTLLYAASLLCFVCRFEHSTTRHYHL